MRKFNKLEVTMEYFLENDTLKLKIASHGAEMKSLIKKSTSIEYLWKADPAYWGRTAPVLFPIVGRVVDDNYTVDGKKYCHIIDPETLMPAEYVSAVSVVCNDSALADSLSTALFNMSVENGKALVESLGGVEAVWTDKNGKVYYSSGFEDLIR